MGFFSLCELFIRAECAAESRKELKSEELDHREQEEQEEVREEEERLYLGSGRDRSRAAAPGGPPPPPQTAGSSSSARPAQQRMNEAARGGEDAVRGVSRDRRELRDHPASLRVFKDGPHAT